MPLPDLLQFIGLARKTGVLTLEGAAVPSHLVFEDGLAVFGVTGPVDDFVSRQLIARTTLERRDVTAALEEVAKAGVTLEAALGRRGIKSSDLQSVLARKVEDAIYDAFELETGTFSFKEGPPPEELTPIRLHLNWQDVVLEGARRSDEAERIRRVLPDAHVRLRTMPDNFPPGFPRTGGDKKLVELVEQRQSVAAICTRFHASDFEVLQRVATLVDEGMLAVDDAEPVAVGEESVDGVMARVGGLIDSGALPEAVLLLRNARTAFPNEAVLTDASARHEAALRARFEAEHGGTSAIPTLVVRLEQLTVAKLDARQAFIASRLSERWTVAEIAAVCPFDEIEILAALEQLCDLGLVELRSECPV